MFYIGQKVVCIDANGDHPDHPGTIWMAGEELVQDSIYTIKSIHNDAADNPVFHLYEISRHHHLLTHWGPTTGYGRWRFRPLLKKKTDISIFTDMLNTIKQSEDA